MVLKIARLALGAIVHVHYDCFLVVVVLPTSVSDSTVSLQKIPATVLWIAF